MPPAAASRDHRVEGMTCAHCVAAVTEEVSAVRGVASVDVDVDLGSGRLAVHGSGFDDAAVDAAVQEAGYALAS